MAFIGNQPITAAFLTDTFSGNGSTVAFTMTVAPANTSSIIVAITGVLQDPSTYSVSGTTLTFSAAPPSGTSNISVRYLGIPASGVTTTAYRTVTNTTATAGQTSFSVPSYTVGYIDVYRNGVRLVSTDYTATTGTTVVLNNACTVGDSVVTESFLVSSVLNAIPATAGSVAVSYLVDGSITTSKLADVATQANQETGTSTTTLVTSGRQQYHQSAAKAWVVFNGTGTPAINASYNVSSLTDLATGRYTVNFTTAFSSVNYSATGMIVRDLVTGIATIAQDTTTVPTASGFSVITQGSGTPTDFTFVHMQFFGDQS
jgi:hypothetical protein